MDLLDIHKIGSKMDLINSMYTIRISTFILLADFARKWLIANQNTESMVYHR